MGFPHFYVLHQCNTLLTLLQENNQFYIYEKKKIPINIDKNMYNIQLKLVLGL